MTDDRSILPMSAVVHSDPIMDAVGQSRLVSKAVDIVEVDG